MTPAALLQAAEEIEGACRVACVDWRVALLGAIRLEHALIFAALALGIAAGFLLARSRLARRVGSEPDPVRRILLPFTGTAPLARRALDAALRLARAEDATLMPAYLAAVPKDLPLECAIPAEAAQAMAILEAIEQRAAAKGVAVDSRIERGRTYRHALARLLAEETFDRVVVSATATGSGGISGDDLVWLLDKAPAEVLILRPAPADHTVLTAAPPPHQTSQRRKNRGTDLLGARTPKRSLPQ